MELAQNPLIQEALYKEVKDFSLEQDNVMERLHNLTYLEHVLKESQRLHPVVGAVIRETVKDIEMLGYSIPKGTRVSANIRGIHQSARYYKDPTSFLPDRWNDEQINVNAYLPFGAGAHGCIGQKMAIIEIKVILISLLQKFKFDLRQGQTFEFLNRITYSVRNLMITVSNR